MASAPDQTAHTRTACRRADGIWSVERDGEGDGKVLNRAGRTTG